MEEKISWYRELLEFDPNSILFFPLAKLLLAQDQVQVKVKVAEALAVLRHGLDRHPDFFEARLLYIEILEGLGRKDSGELEAQVRNIADKLSAYPVFWRVWARFARLWNVQQDFVFALNFVAVSLHRRGLSLLDILSTGLRNSMDDIQEITKESSPECRVAVEKKIGLTRERLATVSECQISPSYRVSTTPAATSVPLAMVVSSMSPQDGVVVSEGPKLVLSGDRMKVDRGMNEVTECTSLRTRTMADLLAEQGDNQGAIEIYRELLAVTSTESEQEELYSLIKQLQLNVRAVDFDDIRYKKPWPLGKRRFFGKLEALARRLDARAVA